MVAADGPVRQKVLHNCRAFTLGKPHTAHRAGLWQYIMKVWHIDHSGSLVKSAGCIQILVIIDAFLKLCRFCPVVDKSAAAAIIALRAVFVDLGYPTRVIADRGTGFAAKAPLDFLNENSVALHHIATRMPRGEMMQMILDR